MVPEPSVQAQAAGQGESHDGHQQLTEESCRPRACQGNDDIQNRHCISKFSNFDEKY
jgi:hypothetical protein